CAKTGNKIAARIAIIAITTSNSMSVKAAAKARRFTVSMARLLRRSTKRWTIRPYNLRKSILRGQAALLLSVLRRLGCCCRTASQGRECCVSCCERPVGAACRPPDKPHRHLAMLRRAGQPPVTALPEDVGSRAADLIPGEAVRRDVMPCQAGIVVEA